MFFDARGRYEVIARAAKISPRWPWASARWLMQPKARPAWFDPEPALQHAGGLKDTPHGRRKYVEYLAWLAEDEPARKAFQFETMSKGWVIGSPAFKKSVAKEHRALSRGVARAQEDQQEAREAAWSELLEEQLVRASKSHDDLAQDGKSAEWKLALAATLKTKTTVTNRWLAENLHLGNMYEVSRKVSAWMRAAG